MLLSGRPIWPTFCLLVAAYGAIAGEPIWRYDPRSWQTNCHDWVEMRQGAYVLQNNVWGRDAERDYRQCIGVRPGEEGTVFRWEWYWPYRVDQVKAYPAVLFGHKPWNKASTTPLLPVDVDRLNSLNVEYDQLTLGNGIYNLLLEAWLTEDNPPTPHGRRYELAIHLYQNNIPGQAGHFIRDVEIDGDRYAFYVNPRMTVFNDDHEWTYLGFVYQGGYRETGRVSLQSFLVFLRREGYLQGKSYLASVELGNEIIEGRGLTELRRFEVSVDIRPEPVESPVSEEAVESPAPEGAVAAEADGPDPAEDSAGPDDSADDGVSPTDPELNAAERSTSP